MEVKLVHPDDPDKKVVIATDEHQVAAFRSHGFVDVDDLKQDEENKVAEEKTVSELQAELAATKDELTETKEALKKAKADLKATKKTKTDAGDTSSAEGEGEN